MSIGQLPRRETKEPKAPKTSKTWTGIGALLVLVLVVVAAGWLIFFPRAEKSSNDIQILNPPASAQVAPEGSTGVCNFPVRTSNDTGTIIPADTAWQLNGTMAAPRSPTAGPMNDQGGLATCFARTPSGALLAISNLIVELANPSLDMTKVVDTQVLHSTGYEQLNIQVQDWVAGQNAGNNAGNNAGAGVGIRQIVGFRLITYSPDFVVIDVVQRGTSGAINGKIATQTYLLQWSDDDWKMVPPIDGNDMPAREMTSVTTPYIPFSGA